MFAVSFDFLIAFFQATEVSIFVVSSFLLKSTGKYGCFHVGTCRTKVKCLLYWSDQLTNWRLSHQHLSMQVFESQVVERRIAEQFRGGMSRAVCPPRFEAAARARSCKKFGFEWSLNA